MSATRRGPESRREELVAAAVRAFARKGFHGSRVSDIAEEAGVSHGLVYHYFDSKEAVLETVFRENWGGLADAIEAIAAGEAPALEQLRRIVAVVLHAWQRDPDTVRVLVREIARSPQLQERVEEFQRAIDAIGRVIERGQRGGELERGLDPRVAALGAWGMLDELLTAWVLGRLPSGPADADRAEATITAMLRRALAA